MNKPHPEELLRRFTYNLETGDIRYRVYVPASHRPVGSLAGRIRKDGRRVISISGKIYLATHIIWAMVTGEWPSLEIDHKDTDGPKGGIGDRWDNLRLATHRENLSNKKTTITNKSGFRGVDLHKKTNKYRVRISTHGKEYYLGLFADYSLAVTARKNAEVRLFGEFRPYADKPEAAE